MQVLQISFGLARFGAFVDEAVQKATETVLGRALKLQKVIDTVKAGIPLLRGGLHVEHTICRIAYELGSLP